MFNTLFCLFFASLIQTNDLKKDFKRIANFNPAAIYTYKHALRIITSSNRCGNQLLEQINTAEETEKLPLLQQASTYFNTGANGIYFKTDMPEIPVGVLKEPLSLYLKTYASYQTLLLSPAPTIMDAFGLKKSYSDMQELLNQQPHILTPTQLDSLDAMLVEGFRATGSPVLLDTLLQSSLLYSPEVVSSLWDGMQTWDNESFAQNMQILSHNSLDFLKNTTILNDPLLTLLFFRTCINKCFNPFTLETDVNAFESLKNPMLKIIKKTLHQDLLDEQNHAILKDTLGILKQHSITQLFKNGTPQQIITLLEESFNKHKNIYKIYKNYQLISPLLQKHLDTVNNYAHLMITLCMPEEERTAHHLFPYVDLCASKMRHNAGLKHLQRNPSAIGLVCALEKTIQEKNWEELDQIIPPLVTHLGNLSYDELHNQINFFYTLDKNNEILNNISPISSNMLLTHYYTFLVHRALVEKKDLPIYELVDYHLQSREYANTWLETEMGQEQLNSNQQNVNLFLENGITLGIIAQSSKLLTLHGKQIARIIAHDPSTVNHWKEVTYATFKHLEEHNKAEFTQYLKNAETCTSNAYSALLNILAFLYCMEQDQNTADQKIPLTQDFLNELALQPAEKLEDLTSDFLYSIVHATYDKYGHKELLCVIRDHAPSIEDLAFDVATQIGRLKDETLDNKINSLIFLEKADIFKTLEEHPKNPSAVLVLADAKAGYCGCHASFDTKDYRTSQLHHLNELEAYITKLKTFSFDESDKVEDKLFEIETVYHKEKLLWNMEYDYQEAFETLKTMVDSSNHNSLQKLHCVNYAVTLRQSKNRAAFEEFFKYCLTYSIGHPEYKAASAFLTSLVEKNPQAFNACLDVLKENFSFLLATGLLQNIPTLEVEQQESFASYIESQIPLWRTRFMNMEKDEQSNLLLFLNTTAQLCISPRIELMVLELQHLLTSCANNNLVIQDKILPQSDDTLRRLITQLQSQFPQTANGMAENYAEKYKFLHSIFDKFMACNFFEEARKYTPKDSQPLYNLLYGQVLWIACQMHYAKIMPKATEYESLVNQIKYARSLITLVKRLYPAELNGKEKVIEALLKSMDGFELSFEFQQDRQKCVSYLVNTLDAIFNEFDSLEKKEEIIRRINFCFPTGALHDCVRYLEGKTTDSREKMLLCYLSFVIAKNSTDIETKREYIRKIIDIGITKPFNAFGTQTLAGVYEGSILEEFKDDIKANELQDLIYKEVFEKYNASFKSNQWSRDFKRLAFAAENGFTNVALVLTQIYSQNNRLEDAREYALQAIKNELYFLNNQPGSYSETLHKKAEDLHAQLTHKLFRQKRRN